MRGVAVFIGAVASATNAYAAEPMVTSKDPNSVTSALQSAGYSVTAQHAPDGSPILSVKKGDAGWFVRFNNCTKGENCTSLYLDSVYSNVTNVTPQLINDRYYRVVAPSVSFYVDDKGALEFNAVMYFAAGPAPRAFFLSTFDKWVTGAAGGVAMILEQP